MLLKTRELFAASDVVRDLYKIIRFKSCQDANTRWDSALSGKLVNIENTIRNNGHRLQMIIFIYEVNFEEQLFADNKEV